MANKPTEKASGSSLPWTPKDACGCKILDYLKQATPITSGTAVNDPTPAQLQTLGKEVWTMRQELSDAFLVTCIGETPVTQPPTVS